LQTMVNGKRRFGMRRNPSASVGQILDLVFCANQSDPDKLLLLPARTECRGSDRAARSENQAETGRKSKIASGVWVGLARQPGC
jgi:hypothetical protein